jgi:hypothetical protein
MSRTEHLVTIPPARAVSLGYIADGLPGLLTVNAALHQVSPRIVFRWNLSVLIDCRELSADRLPTRSEQDVLHGFGTELHQQLGADGNALFAAQTAHDGGAEIIWRVHDPQPARKTLEALISSGAFPREFSFRLDDDPQWSRIEEHLAQVI